MGKGKPFYLAEKIWKKPAKKLWSRLKTEDMKNFCEMMAEMRLWHCILQETLQGDNGKDVNKDLLIVTQKIKSVINRTIRAYER